MQAHRKDKVKASSSTLIVLVPRIGPKVFLNFFLVLTGVVVIIV